MANKKKRKHKEVFHKPQTVGERTKLKMTPALIALSALSLGVQIGGTIFAIVGAAILHNQGYGQSGLLLALPIMMWVISIVARLGFKYLPLDMWRMPVDVRKGMVVCNGWLLKLTTLLVELECAATFCYVDIALYLGYAPLDAVMLAWLVALALSVWLPCRKAGRIGRGEAIWTANEDKQPE
ncbi:MAG: hypothetical protein SOW00_00975 [Oscillospiraceae bacterium]|nr:hypothetical protein [Oscillospiraceae bacterium]